MYMVDADDADAVAAVHGEVFRQVRPAATLVIVARLMRPTLLVEIEAEARRGLTGDARAAVECRAARRRVRTRRRATNAACEGRVNEVRACRPPATRHDGSRPQPATPERRQTPSDLTQGIDHVTPSAGLGPTTSVFDRGQRGEHRRPDETQVEQRLRREALDPGRQDRQRRATGRSPPPSAAPGATSSLLMRGSRASAQGGRLSSTAAVHVHAAVR